MARTSKAPKPPSAPKPSKAPKTETTALPIPTVPTQPVPGFFSHMMQGMAFGTGSSMGHRAVDALSGSKPVDARSGSGSITPLPVHTTSCETMLDNYHACMNQSQPQCQPFYDAYTDCLSTVGHASMR